MNNMDYDKHFEQVEAMLAYLRRQLDLQDERIASWPRLTSRQADKTDELAERVSTIADYESRFRRLEDAVFKQAS